MKDFVSIYKKIKMQAPEHHFEFRDPFWVLITTILSQRTKDNVTDASARALYNRYHDAAGLAMAKPEDVKKIIKNVGFSNVKSKRVIDAAKYILKNYNGNVPDTYEELMKIKGVGTKTANIVLTQSFNKPAIPVDTHVHRIVNRIGFVNTRTPEETETELKKIIPLEYQIEFNPVLVEFGKNICKPVSPKCDICLVRDCCDYYSRKSINNVKANKA
ncbi:endonuclease III domain-containing protein [Picrophilus oshimae]|uniref:Endonuclease III n=1 Tax=Picrophilus torridus (strain ATCC 700027 / DSM 9790 / JCM 10055 / NBRC 100828 / KAW 2/3) TaxID=1122961 RepID=A0A8G2L6Q0_PICTO|nr:endonuclease III [Picrophilus oshimae]SMD30208.1 endonuclease-3 [Picrophilus oshimae DSM 9789]